jgi:hypothetical protein
MHIVTKWPPVTCGHSGTIYNRLAPSCMQTLHALTASCMQSRQFFASMLQEQLFELKNEEVIKNLGIYTQSHETVPLSKKNLGINHLALEFS